MPALNQNTKKDLIDTIIEITANFYGIDVEKFIVNSGKSINHEAAYRKHMCYFMVREYTFLSYDQIALRFTTVQSTIKNGVNKINDFKTYNRRTIAEIKEIKILIDNFRTKSQQQSLAN
jgi:chromosomal replication initiation ATPase DnaA